jgi:hypothetical protein
MTRQPVPARHWRSYGDDPLPSGRVALDEPFSALPLWFMRITCDRCGKVSVLHAAHTTGRRREMPIRALLARMRHDGCGGQARRVELLTGIEAATSLRCARSSCSTGEPYTEQRLESDERYRTGMTLRA